MEWIKEDRDYEVKVRVSGECLLGLKAKYRRQVLEAGGPQEEVDEIEETSPAEILEAFFSEEGPVLSDVD